MDKKIRNLLIIAGVLVLSIVVYLIIIKLTKEETPAESNSAVSEQYWAYDNEQVVGLSLKGKENFSFSFNTASSIWTSDADSTISVNQTAVTAIVSQLKQLTYSRVIEEYSSLDEYKLSEPALTITVSFESGKKLEIRFSDMEGYNSSYYFKDTDSDKVYITSSELYSYAEYDLYDFIQMVEVPDFSTAEIDKYNFNTISGEKITVFKNNDLSSDDETVFDYQVVDSDGKAVNSGTVNSSDSKIMNNYVNEFMLNRVTDYSPDEAALKEYGLLDKKPSVSFEFSGYTTKLVDDGNGNEISQIVECEFTYMITVGNPTSDSKGEYYVMVSCVESENEISQYDSKFVYTANAIYSEYFLEFDEGNVNGKKMILNSLLGKDEIPELSTESVKTITIDNNETDECIKLTIDSESASFVVFKASEPDTIVYEGEVDSTAYKQFCEFLFASNNLSYNESVCDNSEENLITYGLDAPARVITFDYVASHTDEEGNCVDFDISWSLMIGSISQGGQEDTTSYYVTASNTDYILTMSGAIVDYLYSIDKNILDGTVNYGEAEIEAIK